MAKADFCFTYYDGDATRDMAHMNRLERGAYNDVIIQQRQRGHLSIEDLKKFLSKDFDTVWPALEWVFKIDAEGKYFIEWLENSIKKAAAHSKKQSGNVRNRYQEPTKDIPKQTLETPLGSGDGDEKGLEFEEKRVQGEKHLVPQMQAIFKKHIKSYGPNQERDFKPLFSIAEYIAEQLNIGPPVANAALVLQEWEAVCLHLSDPQNFYHSKSLKTISTHIQEVFQKQKNGNSKNSRSGHPSGGGVSSTAIIQPGKSFNTSL
jgi:hypothetical protein